MTATLPTLSLVDTDPTELGVDAIIIGVYGEAPGATGTPERARPAQPLLLAPGAESVAAAFDRAVSDGAGGGGATAGRKAAAGGKAGAGGGAAGSGTGGGTLVSTLALLGATGAVGEVTKLASLGTLRAPVVAAVGLGARPAATGEAATGEAATREAALGAETLRRAAGAAVRALAGLDSVALAVALPSDPDAGTGPLRALAEGGVLGGYRFTAYKSRQAPGRRHPVRAVSVHVADAADKVARAEVKRAVAITRAVATTRDWVNTAPNDLRPPAFADAVASAATSAGLSVDVLDEKALKRGGYGGILAVGLGSSAPPRLVRISYTPSGPRTAPAATASGRGRAATGGTTGYPRIALIGKGITFDSGGLSIKHAHGMWEMKSDMAGAAAVAGTMLAIAALKPRAVVTGYLPMAENMPSGSAYRPGDVVTMYSGANVEVLNTDAEGRMVLADAMARACEDGTDYLLETSTLTGGQVTALGRRVAGVMGTPELCERVRVAGERVGEPSWPMPLPEDVRKGMDSDVADISQVNAGMDRAGHMLQGGIFLSEFVTGNVPWAHIDIAGPSYHPGEPTGYWAKGGTGVPLRTLVELVESIAAGR